MAPTLSSLSIPVRVRLVLGSGLLVMGSACSYFDTTGGGLALDPATGVLSGTPMVLTAQAPYVVTAENARGRASVTLSLVVVAQPVLAVQPSDRSVGVGQDATFQVSASDALPLSYQWRRLPGAGHRPLRRRHHQRQRQPDRAGRRYPDHHLAFRYRRRWQ